MSFDPDPDKQDIDVCFSDTPNKENYPPLQFNSIEEQIADSQKH